VETVIYFFVFIFGAVVGSFLNVVVLRYNTGRSITIERSQCFSCGKTLKWFELIPIFSFIAQRGRCRSCGSKISFQYITVEILTGLVFLLIFNYQFSITNEFSNLLIFNILYLWTIFSILIAISVYDLRHKIIPDALVFLFVGFSFLKGLFDFLDFGNWDLSGIWNLEFGIWLAAGPLIALPFFLLWFFSRGRWMGFGDVKLALGIGWFLGLALGTYALLWSFWIGGAFSLGALLLKYILSSLEGKSSLFLRLKGLTIKSEIPFGPFLVLGTAVAFLLEWDFLFLNLMIELL